MGFHDGDFQKMTPIQVVLSLSILLLFLSYLSFFRSVLFDRVIALSIFLLLLLAIVFPDFTTTLANLLGVGRGVDLLLYLFAVGTLFSLVILYTQISKTKQLQTEIIRSIAINNAEKLN